MKTALAVFVAIGTAFLMLDTGIAIKCFVCNSFHQADCVDWFDNVTQHLVQCFDWQTKCRKVVQEGIAIKCFVCNSFHQADCVDWFDNVTQHLVQCFDWQTKCRKVVQEVWLDDHWDVRYIRQCAGDGEIGPYQGRICQERYGSYNVRMRYCHCDNQDGCNSAPSVSGSFISWIVTLLSAAVPFVFVRHR